MKLIHKLLFTVIPILAVFSAWADEKTAECQGEISLQADHCGATLTIGNKVIGRCLTKDTAMAFKSFYADCLENRSVISNANPNTSSINIALQQTLAGQCGGKLEFSPRPAPCGINFLLIGETPQHKTFSSDCHDPKSLSDRYMADLRKYCEYVRTSAPANFGPSGPSATGGSLPQ